MILSFIIPVRDDAARLARCLRSIAANDQPAAQVRTVVADNGSSDGSVDVARSAGATILALPGLRVSALRNRAAAAAAGDILAFVDADHEIVPTWIAATADIFNDPHVAAAGALYTPPPDGTWTQRMFGVLRGRTVGRSDAAWLGSGNLAVRRAVFEQMRGFDESLETCEDVDLCQRIRQAGHRIVADERLGSVHRGDPKSLRELFLSERWRGRDNIRVTLRSGFGLRDLPSIVIPVIEALALVAVVVGFAAARPGRLHRRPDGRCRGSPCRRPGGPESPSYVPVGWPPRPRGVGTGVCGCTDLRRRPGLLARLARGPSPEPAQVSEPIRVLELRSVRGTGGGPEKTILQGARRADPSRFKVTVCYLRDQRDREFTIDRRADDLGLDYVEIHERHSYDPAIWSQLRKPARDRSAQIVHAHEYKTNILTWLLARYEPIVPLSTVHGWFGRDTWRERVYYGADRRVLARFPRIIAVSAMLRDELVAAGCSPDRITVITNGIDHHAFARVPGRREEMRRSLGIADTDVVIGAVGRLERQKLFEVLMEAVAHASAGDDPTSASLSPAPAASRTSSWPFTAGSTSATRACCWAIARTSPRSITRSTFLSRPRTVRARPTSCSRAMALETPTIATDAGGTGRSSTTASMGSSCPPITGTPWSPPSIAPWTTGRRPWPEPLPHESASWMNCRSTVGWIVWNRSTKS